MGMSADVCDAIIILAALIGMSAMYALGRGHGVAAERLRVQYLVDVARCTVSSWSVVMLREAFEQRISIREMREGLRNWKGKKRDDVQNSD
jgi:hypothetical protein